MTSKGSALTWKNDCLGTQIYPNGYIYTPNQRSFFRKGEWIDTQSVSTMIPERSKYKITIETTASGLRQEPPATTTNDKWKNTTLRQSLRQ